MRRIALLASVSAVAMLFGGYAQAQTVKNYNPVTAERLTNPEPGNWLTIRRTYDGEAHTPLTQITPGTSRG